MPRSASASESAAADPAGAGLAGVERPAAGTGSSVGTRAVPSDRSRWALAAFMAGAGVLHFAIPEFYERIVPKWLGHDRAVVQWSGAAELLCGALLALPRTKRVGAWLTVLTIMGVYPANVQMAIDAGIPRDAEGWVAWLRLPLQVPMIRWAWKHTQAEPATPPR